MSATQFPTAIDTNFPYPNLDAVYQLETKVGINDSDTESSLDYQVAQLQAKATPTRSIATPTIDSGTAYKNTKAYTVNVALDVTGASDGTLETQLSSNGSTFTSLGTVSAAVDILVVVPLPSGWSVKFTATTASIAGAVVY